MIKSVCFCKTRHRLQICANRDTIAIEKLKNSIVINNKGELLFPESDFGKRSEARNRLLVDLLARTDFMEKAGSRAKKIKLIEAMNPEWRDLYDEL